MLGITHGDIRENHFKLPKVFYDTVLHDIPIFPFLEAVCPEGSPAWHISPARLLGEYNPYTVLATFDCSQHTIVSCLFAWSTIKRNNGIGLRKGGMAFVLLLLRRAWVMPAGHWGQTVNYPRQPHLLSRAG